MKKIILFKNGIETLGFFSLELEKAFEKSGHEVYVIDLLEEEKSFQQLLQFCEDDQVLVVTFNFTGLRGETCFYPEQKENFWDERKISCINLVVDHPFYYHELIQHAPKKYYQMCIDSYHETYMKRFFPNIQLLPWMPLGGTQLRNKSWKDRSYDIVFTGNYTPPKTFEKHITRINEEYTEFYYRIIDDLINHPQQSMEEAFEKHLKIEMPDITDHDLRECMGNLIFIDLYVRFYYRGLVVATLVDAGCEVHCFGAGWELLECEHPENLKIGGSLNSSECLDKISNAKISLNVMPWFKDGAHDRIFNSMLNGAVSLTDDSKYLREHFSDEEDILFYSLRELDSLASRVKELLGDDEKMQVIAKRGYINAMKYHTWEKRAEQLCEYIKELWEDK